MFKNSLLALSVLASVGFSTTAMSGDADFTMVNRTGYSIREVYISAANRNAWGRDRLGDGTLDNSRSKLFKFSDAANCKQDIKVVFDDDASEVTWEDVDLCAINKLTLKYNRSNKTVSADVE